MKIDELMIGDIVYRKMVDNKWGLLKVTKGLLTDIDEYENLYKPVLFSDENIEEILESFHIIKGKDENGNVIYKENGHFWHLDKYGNTWFLNGGIFNNVPIATLHQLQHALKLTNVEKTFEID